jgi:hypothetical protein
MGEKLDRGGRVDNKPKRATRSMKIWWPVEGAGDGLLSRVLADGVPSALQGLTIVFGMGTSVAPAL